MLTTIEKVLLLMDLDLLRLASTDHLAELASQCTERTEAAGKVLFRMGEAHDTLHFLVAGRVVLEKADLERQEVAQRPLDFWSCLTQSRHRYSAVCVEECTLLAAPTAAILDLVDEQPEFGVALLKQLAAQVVQDVPYL